MPAELRAMKPGSTSAGVRETCDSSETTAPMCGAMAPVAPVGLRAICAHSCPSWCTAAHARPGRTKLMRSRCSDVFGSSPCGKRMVPPLKSVGANEGGVHAPSFRSHMSVLLGAPARKMKMAPLAVLRTFAFDVVAPCSSDGLRTSAKYDATTPVPAIFRNRRRVKPGPRAMPLDLLQVGHSI